MRQLAENGADVPAVGQSPDIVVDPGVRTVELQHVAAGMRGKKVERGRPLGEFPGAGDRQACSAKHLLGVGAIIFQAVAVRAAADDVESLAPQLVLQLAAILRDILEQNDPILAGGTNPVELAAPIGGLLHQPGKRAAGRAGCRSRP